MEIAEVIQQATEFSFSRSSEHLTSCDVVTQYASLLLSSVVMCFTAFVSLGTGCTYMLDCGGLDADGLMHGLEGPEKPLDVRRIIGVERLTKQIGKRCCFQRTMIGWLLALQLLMMALTTEYWLYAGGDSVWLCG